jgi:hypothetical protein
MTLGGIVILLLLVISLSVFIYLAVITARGWGALHTTMLCFLFIECWVFIFFAAGVHRERISWLKQLKTLEEKSEKAEAETKRLTLGGVDASETLDAVVPAQGALRRMTADRGRVWRRLEFRSFENNLIRLEMTAAKKPTDELTSDPTAPAAPVAAASAGGAESLPANTVVYGFVESTQGDMPVPNFYLGEFSVTESVGGAIAIKPTLNLDKAQLEKLNSGEANFWTLHELLPLDSHTAFVAPGSKPAEGELFGRKDEAETTALFATAPEARREKLIKDYLRDGQRADESDPPSSRWTKIKLIKEYQIDVDSQEEAIATERSFFDKSGRSIDVRLKRGEDGTVKLNPDTEIVVKSEVADDLVSKGIATLIEPIFIRPLNDYQYEFQQNYVRLHETRERFAVYKRETEELAISNKSGQEMISFHQVENQKLASDLGHYRSELVVLDDEIAEATKALTSLKSTLTAMYQSIQTSHP